MADKQIINLKAPKGVIKITVEVIMPRPERPDLCDHVACEPILMNVMRHKDKRHIAVEIMPAVRSVIAQMSELARTHVHAPLSPEKEIEKPEKPKGLPQIELHRVNMMTGETEMVGKPTILGPNMEPIQPLKGSVND